ncbi:MAG TPA: hypothetical protein RMH99_07435 [Sandaracinaceae bacterium LLY-WYZ-13_1]|nr:hypothetical protein [Sandaracinaceae bacterium LLY-WYZ-13_1]
MPRAAAPSLVALLVFALAPPCAEAQAGMRVTEVESVRVDGAIRDWRGAHFATVGRGPDASMRFALGHDDEGLYVAAQVWDERIVRTPRPGAREDAVIVTLAFPRGRRLRAFDVYLFAGVSGRSAASAGIAPAGRSRVRPLSSARVVEGPLTRRGRGYTLEAFVPFSALPGSSRWDRGRGSIRLRDVDAEAHPEVENEPALVEVDPRHLDRLVPLMPTGGAGGALTAFLNERGLGAARPRHDLRGDVAGDDRPERVFVVDRYVVVTGPGYRDGGGYGYQRLAVDDAQDVRDAELHDLTGDGNEELVLVLRQRNDQGERDLWQVMSLAGDSPRPIFGIEIRKATRQGSVEARIRIVRGRGRRPPQIEIRAHRARGLDRESYRESPASDVEPILLPWGPVRSRRYRWGGRGFERTGERRNPRYRPPEEPSRGEARASRPAEPSEPEAPSEGELLAEFRRRSGIRRGTRPRFRLRANLAGGRGPERVHVYGRRLVVVGEGIQGGRSFLSYEVPADGDEDLLDVSAADVTGDGRAELLFRVRQRFDDVQREVLLVHRITPNGFPRLLQVEVARRRDGHRVVNQVVTRGGRLVIRPGRARGWGEDDWPFTQDPNDSVEPLLLPWRDRPVRYRLRGGRLVR